jgi:hypothetical protein
MKAAGKARIAAASLLALVICSCRPGQVSKQRLIDLIGKDKELSQSQEIKGIKVQLRYVPYQLMVAQELGSAANAGDTATLARLERKYSPQYYYRLTFSKDNKEVIRQLGSFHQYSDMLQLLSFDLSSHICASTERNDTLYLKDYAYQEEYGLSKENASLLVFARQDFSKDKEIRVRIDEFGLGIGELTFVFNKEEMEQLPLLDYRRLD